MKLSIENCMMRERFGDEAAMRMIRDAGFDAVDYSFYWARSAREILGSGYRERAARMRGVLDEIGLACNQAHAPFQLKRTGTLSMDCPEYAQVVRSMEYASILGASEIVVHAVGDANDPDFFEFNRDFYRGLTPYARAYGIRIAVENLFDWSEKGDRAIGKLATPYELNRLLDTLDPQWVAACVDIGHAGLTAEEPEQYLAGMSADRLVALHVQDGDYRHDLHTLPYLGQFNWDAIMDTLARIGYTGDLTMEVFHYQGKFPRDLLPDALRLAAAVGRHLIRRFTDAAAHR